jgi:protein-tyrosine phosphatase
MTKIMFVCLGNICRSPAAEAILKQMVDQDENLEHVEVDSCGMGDWYRGKSADERMREAAKLRGYDLAGRAKQFLPAYFEECDLILAADHEVLTMLHSHATELEKKSKIHLMTNWSENYKNQEVPDPYYYGVSAFDMVLDIIEDACEGLKQHLHKDKLSG